VKVLKYCARAWKGQDSPNDFVVAASIRSAAAGLGCDLPSLVIRAARQKHVLDLSFCDFVPEQLVRNAVGQALRGVREITSDNVDGKLDWEDRSYMCRCSSCGVEYYGPKRSPSCAKCFKDAEALNAAEDRRLQKAKAVVLASRVELVLGLALHHLGIDPASADRDRLASLREALQTTLS